MRFEGIPKGLRAICENIRLLSPKRLQLNKTEHTRHLTQVAKVAIVSSCGLVARNFLPSSSNIYWLAGLKPHFEGDPFTNKQ